MGRVFPVIEQIGTYAVSVAVSLEVLVLTMILSPLTGL